MLVISCVVQLRTYSAANSCFITGEVTSENMNYGQGKVVLSPKGAGNSLQEIEEQQKKQDNEISTY
ncbi:hypothetical protein LCY76_23720 [Fictibacillus sp. KIGAM418]|uniref:AbrB C-terminal domain-containing protein n=1 Tax=Fictibacillus marinisediminis TaxID=2878389 RepID=A0A9X1XF75_9BACL|nr:hypothetical protein [Fictibacillus marinisediminis]MCK6259581.1 hypothetical protein [Fictibacillus marinisediminis]